MRMFNSYVIISVFVLILCSKTKNIAYNIVFPENYDFFKYNFSKKRFALILCSIHSHLLNPCPNL